MSGQCIAWHNEPALHESAKARMRAHVDADRVIQGSYVYKERGCWKGCLISDAAREKLMMATTRIEMQNLLDDAFLVQFGLSSAFARDDEALFEGVDESLAPLVAEYMTAVIPSGFDSTDWAHIYREEPGFLGVSTWGARDSYYFDKLLWQILAQLQRLAAEQDIPLELDPVKLLPHRFPQSAQPEAVTEGSALQALALLCKTSAAI